MIKLQSDLYIPIYHCLRCNFKFQADKPVCHLCGKSDKIKKLTK